jgi:hypothetical protein
LLQRTQMDEPVLGAPAVPLEILWNHREQHCFSERNIWILQRWDAMRRFSEITIPIPPNLLCSSIRPP